MLDFFDSLFFLLLFSRFSICLFYVLYFFKVLPSMFYVVLFFFFFLFMCLSKCGLRYSNTVSFLNKDLDWDPLPYLLHRLVY